jgi:hypothetical protein
MKMFDAQLSCASLAACMHPSIVAAILSRASEAVSAHTAAPAGIQAVAAPLLNGPWNVRNFGGAPLIEGDVGGTVLRRTAGETQAVVQLVNAKLLTK